MRILKTLGLALLVVAAMACANEEPANEVKVNPEVTSSSLASGTKDLALEPFEIKLLFNRSVVEGDLSKITLSPAKSLEVSAQNTSVRIAITEELDYETDYTLTIAAGALLDKATSAENKSYVITFRTKDEPYAPPTDPTKTLVMPNAMPSAQRIYDYLWESYGEKCLSGAMAKVAWNIDEAQWVYNNTGKWPAMATFDYIHLDFSPANWIDYTDTTVAEEWWEAGGIVSAAWHWNVPVSEGSSTHAFYTDGNSFSVKRALREGTWENEVMKADLAEMADMLLLLQDKGIPVVWRPLHEAAGNIYEPWHGTAWFWWGNDGAEAYRELWHTMFDYFVERGINNLIWVWTTQLNDMEFYPGDEYVDMVSRDIYNVTNAADYTYQWQSVVQHFPHKMITLSEMGNVAHIGDQLDAGAMWSYFMPWYDNDNDFTTGYKHMHADIAWWRNAFEDSRIITRDELPSFK